MAVSSRRRSIGQEHSDRLEPLLQIETFGGFRAWRGAEEIPPTAWGREKAIQLLQLFVTFRRKQLHKEQIIDMLWPELEPGAGDRDFKVALNAIQKAIEPDRRPRAPSPYIQRLELTYGLNLDALWIDAEAFELHVQSGNQLLPEDRAAAVREYRAAVQLYRGTYLPERRYEDWTASERERLQILALGTMTRLGEILLPEDPLEGIRLGEQVLGYDRVWEEAYRLLMQAYMATGNRPMAIRSYQRCEAAIREEFGVEPLPETQKLYQAILEKS